MKTAKLLPQDRTELSDAGARELRVRELPQDAWTEALRQGLVREAIDPPNQPGYDAFVRALREHRREHPEVWPATVARRTAARTSDPGRLLSKGELVRARYETDRVAKLARDEPLVDQTREQLFAGHVLSDDEARQLMASFAIRYLTPHHFRALEVPLVGHTSRVCLPDGSPVRGWDPRVVIRLSWGKSQSKDAPYVEEWHTGTFSRLHAVEVTGDGVRFGSRDAVEGSVLWQLGRTSRWLSDLYPWQPYQALWFLLTDVAPNLDPLQVRSSGSYGTRGTRARITIVAAPWIRADRVLAAFRAAQKEHFKRPSRTPSEEKLKLCDFVRPLREADPPVPWQRIKREWRRSHPKSRLTDLDQFRRAYTRTSKWLERELLWPRYKLFTDRTPPTIAKRSGARTATRKQRGPQ